MGKPIIGGRPLLFTTVEELEKKIEQYFASCFDYQRDMFGQPIQDKIPNGFTKSGKARFKPGEFLFVQVKPFTVSGLAVFLNTSRETLMNYEKRDEYFDTIKKAKDRIYAYTEERLFTSKPTGAIFSLKANYGWEDKQKLELEGTMTNNNLNEYSVEQLKKMKEILTDDEDTDTD